MDVMFRQGDVLVLRVKGDADELGERVAEPRDDGRVVLAYGEVTGHAHAIMDEAATLWRLAAGDDRLLLVAGDAPVALRHEEHATIMVPPGAYVVRRQREFAPDDDDEARAFEQTRYVSD